MPEVRSLSERPAKPSRIVLASLPRQAAVQSLRQLAAVKAAPPRPRLTSFEPVGKLLVGVGGSARMRADWLESVAADCRRDDPHTRHREAIDRTRRVTRCDGRQLVRELRRCRSDGSLGPLRKLLLLDGRKAGGPAAVLISQVDQAAGRDDNQFLLCQLFDAILRSPTLLAVTLPHHPAGLSLHPLLESRLTGGLVLPLGESDAGAVTAGPSQSTRKPARAGKQPTPRRVIAAVARYYGLSTADLLGPSQRRRHVRPRGLAFHCLRLLTGLSSHAIGGFCGGRDHTTVLHSLKVTARLLQADPGLAGDLEAIVESLGKPSADLSADC